MKHSKRTLAVRKLIQRGTEYELEQAILQVKKTATAKFNETMEIAVNLGVDPRKADQMIRSTVSLPHGIGKTVRILVLCKEERIPDALAAGADFAGLEEYVEKIQGGWLDFDSCIAAPDVMPQVGKIGKLLGPRGLMPNPKTGTVTANIADAVKEIKAGRLSFRVDKAGILHLPVGKVSFETPKLKDNILSLLATVQRLKPATAKGQYFKGISLCSTMGPGVRVSRASALAEVK
ncbi:MAG: 50S ribosomal protein L1 [Calditrichota bacterium]